MKQQDLASRVAAYCAERSRLIMSLVLVATAALSAPFLFASPDGVASDEPGGEVFEARDAIETRFDGGVASYDFIVESPDGNLLDHDGLTSLGDRIDELRADPDLGPALASVADDQLGARPGVITIADRVSGALGADADQADDQNWRQVSSQIVDETGPVAAGLAVNAERDPETGIWTSPAIVFSIRANADQVAQIGAGDGRTEGEAVEQVGRDIQSVLRDGGAFNVWGIAIDQDLTAAEQGAAAGPFIGLTVLAILVMVGVAFRSYWVLAVTGLGLITLLIWLNGLANLIGMKEDQILATVVPIAMLAFGVDYAFHAIGRYQEERDTGASPKQAYRLGIGGVGAALALALTTGAVAFLANTSSGIESIIQFGITAAIGLLSAFLILGYVVPLVLAAIDQRIAGTRVRWSRALSVGSGMFAAIFAMVVVLLLVFIAPAAGLALTVVYALLFIGLPYALAGRFKMSAAHEPAGYQDSDETRSEHNSVLERSIGKLVVFVANRRVIVLPVFAGITAVAAFFAVQVPASFDVEDFFAQDTDFVVGLNKVDEHIGDQGGETAEIFIEADFSQPGALSAVERFAGRVAESDSDLLARNDSGDVRVDTGILEFVDTVRANGQTDLRAKPGSIQPVLADAAERGVNDDDGNLLLTPLDVAQLGVPATNGMMATRIQVHLVGSREQENIASTRDTLEPLVADLGEDLNEVSPGASATLTGTPIVRQASMDAVARALQVSLPIALVLCFLLAAAFMRSVRYSLITTGAILLVAAWLYGFMYVAGYSVNLVTATIGALSIGIGIDFATHFTMRYREERSESGDQMQALYRTGAGTGTALVGSTISSAAGFIILAFAPMPMFASFGLLTALMIGFALIASLIILPGLLVMADRRA